VSRGSIPDISDKIAPEEMGYREIVDCPFCGSAKYRPITSPGVSDYGISLNPEFRDMKFQVTECEDCGVVYQRNRPNPQHLGQFYETGDYHCYESLLRRGAIIRTAAIASGKKVVAEIDKYRPHKNNTVVDFGCGSGSWIELFNYVKSGWNVVGTEIFPELCATVERDTGSRCIVADHENIDIAFPPNSVDAIFMHHVIEHIPNPLAFLKKTRTILADGGIIYGQTPNWKSWEQALVRDNWVQWHLPHHLVIFDFETIAAHAKAAGFEAVKISSSVSGATQWSASLIKWFAKRQGRPYRATKEPLHAPLTLVFLPLAVIQSFVSRTSHMDFVLRKIPAGA
jgi:SAM-dependent methyltransferase